MPYGMMDGYGMSYGMGILSGKLKELIRDKGIDSENGGILMVEKITKDSKLNEIIEKYPQIREVFIKHGMPKYAGRLPSEKIEFFCRMHRVEINKLLDELNKVAGL